MNDLQRGIIILLKSAITGERLVLPTGFDLSEVVGMIRKHHMPTLIYTGAVNCGIAKDLPVMKQLFQAYCKSMMVSERQMKQLERLFQAFESRKIDYMPLKGSIMKGLYPSPELRMMGDADVLIRTEQYPDIVPVLEELGYSGELDEGHDYAWSSPGLHLEVHKMLMDPRNRDMAAYFGSGWQRARVKCGTQYEMSVEDTFVFMFAHFAKHVINTGIGCRHVVDLWVFLRAHPEMDDGYVRAQLMQLRLDRFYLYMRSLIDAWFDNGAGDEKTEALSDFILSSGSWGKRESAVVTRGIRGDRKAGVASARVRTVFAWLFPSASDLYNDFPVLRKAPWLLPFLNAARLVRKVFTKEIRQQKLKDLASINRDAIDEKRDILQAFGLDDAL